MAIEFITSETTQLKIKFKADNDDFVFLLSKGFISWKLQIISGPNPTISELIDICNFIYSEKVINEEDSIEIALGKDKGNVFIMKKEKITDSILEKVIIALPRNEE